MSLQQLCQRRLVMLRLASPPIISDNRLLLTLPAHPHLGVFGANMQRNLPFSESFPEGCGHQAGGSLVSYSVKFETLRLRKCNSVTLHTVFLFRYLRACVCVCVRACVRARAYPSESEQWAMTTVRLSRDLPSISG